MDQEKEVYNSYFLVLIDFSSNRKLKNEIKEKKGLFDKDKNFQKNKKEYENFIENKYNEVIKYRISKINKKWRNKFFKSFYRRDLDDLKNYEILLKNYSKDFVYIRDEIEPNIKSIEDKYKNDIIKIFFSFSLILIGYLLSFINF